MRPPVRLLALVCSALFLLTGCGDDADDAAPADPGSGDELRPADEANADEDEAKSVTGTIGEPARLVNEFGQDVTVTLRSVEVSEDPEQGRLLVVDVRAENSTDESQNAPEFELMCDGDKMAFYGGTYDWQEMPAGTFLEGTREFEYPDSCDEPELWATPIVGDGESVRWDVTP